MILQSCQEILEKLKYENNSLQSELVKLDSQKKTIQNSIESVQQQITQELARQQGLHQSLKQNRPQNKKSFESPPKPHDDQFGVDFQKEFAGGWDGFDNNFGDQNKNPNATGFNDFAF